MDKKFTFHWLDGHVTESTGPDVATAFNRAGFGGGAIADERLIPYRRPYHNK